MAKRAAKVIQLGSPPFDRPLFARGHWRVKSVGIPRVFTRPFTRVKSQRNFCYMSTGCVLYLELMEHVCVRKERLSKVFLSFTKTCSCYVTIKRENVERQTSCYPAPSLLIGSLSLVVVGAPFFSRSQSTFCLPSGILYWVYGFSMSFSTRHPSAHGADRAVN